MRIYRLDLTSIDMGVYHTMIAWNYPFGDVVMIRNQWRCSRRRRR